MILKRKEKRKKCNMLKKCAQLGIPITFTQFKLKIVVITQERFYNFLGIDSRAGVA
jgi:Na+-driven multidrug efflux pump